MRTKTDNSTELAILVMLALIFLFAVNSCRWNYVEDRMGREVSFWEYILIWSK